MNPQLPITTVVTPWKHEFWPSWIPHHLSVHVGMPIDESRRDHMAVCINLATTSGIDRSDRGNQIVVDGYIGMEWCAAGTIDNEAVPDDQIMHASSPIHA